MTTLKAGDRIPDPAALEELPVGAAVTELRSAKLLTRHPSPGMGKGGWASHQHRTQMASRDVWWDGMELVSLPGITYDGPMVGDVITTLDQLNALPEAAVLRRMDERIENYSAIKTGPNTPDYSTYTDHWLDSTFGLITSERLATNIESQSLTYAVESLPVELFETLDQFKWRFRDLAITGAERALSRHSYAVEILDALKIDFTPSVGMRIVNRFDRGQLPVGTRVYTGNPDDPERFSVAEKHTTGWVPIFGPTVEVATAPVVVVDALPDPDSPGEVKTEPDEWLVKVASPEDAAEVRKLRRSGWVEGLKSKTRHSWCDEFERIMLRGGMSEELTKVSLPGNAKAGEAVSAATAAQFPVGTYFSVSEDNRLVAVYVRVEEASNKAGTQRVWATPRWEKRGNYQKSMVLINEEPGIEEGVPISNIDMLASLPVGSRISLRDRGESFYQKMRDPGNNSSDCWRVLGTDRSGPEPREGVAPQYANRAYFTHGATQFKVFRFGGPA